MNYRLTTGLLALALLGCGPESELPADTDTETSTETGDGDGDPTTGDGDGDPTTGDGDGDPTTGDGDGDPATGDGDPTTGDGDGDPTTGDGDGDGEAELSVLFVGNSYTASNNLPGLIIDIAAGADVTLDGSSVTVGGAWVEDHLMNPLVLEGLGGPYDAVVLQGQSVQPVIATNEFQAAVVEFSELLAMDSDARLVLYQTWPRAEGNDVLGQLGMTQLEMYEALAIAYQGAADMSGAEVGRVGDAWMGALGFDDPPIELYAGDGSHPSLAGSYLAACVLFGQLADTPCGASEFAPDGLSEEDRGRLQAVADITNNFVNPSP